MIQPKVVRRSGDAPAGKSKIGDPLCVCGRRSSHDHHDDDARCLVIEHPLISRTSSTTDASTRSLPTAPACGSQATNAPESVRS